MEFASVRFLGFVAATVTLSFVAPKRFRWVVLLAASLVFYLLMAGAQAVVVSCAITAIACYAAFLIDRETGDRRKRRAILTAAAVVLLGLLGIYKLKPFLGGRLDRLYTPLGISYFTLSLVAYLADVYYKKEKPEGNYFKLLLFTIYFPRIVQGPISRYRELGPRLTQPHAVDYTRICFGMQRMLWGFFKKCVIADRAAMMTRPVFDNFAAYEGGGAVLLVVTLIATVRHYCDFSGYMDIVIGISQMMGIELDENFRRPFFSRNVAEFWRRWHISMGAWFKDYVYMPLVISPRLIRLSGTCRKRLGKRVGKAVLTVIPLAVTWILTGLWHGTGVDYLLWGVYWGTVISIANVFAPEFKALAKRLRIDTESGAWHAVQTVRTFTLFVCGLLLSTFVGRRQLGLYFSTLFMHFEPQKLLLSGGLFELGLDKNSVLFLLAAIALLWCMEILEERGWSIRERVAALPGICRWALYAGLILVVLLLGVYGPAADMSGFEYARF